MPSGPYKSTEHGYACKGKYLSQFMDKKPLHPISAPKVVAEALITSTVPNKITAMIAIELGFKDPIPINPSSFPMLSVFLHWPISQIQKSKSTHK